MDRKQYLLTKIAEEASEIAQIALKTQQFGMYSKHPGETTNNIENLHKEVTDLQAVFRMYCEEVQVDDTIHEFAIQDKISKVERYYQISKQLGEVE